MTFNNCSNMSESVEEYLHHLQDQTNMTMIPAVIMLSIFAITGLIGNTLVLVVYSQKFKLNPTKVLIMTIACFDLVSNVAAIPSEVNIMFDSWNFRQPGVCKSKVFLGSFTTVGGAISLLIVAVVRYRKVCRPYGWQVTIRQSIIASAVTVIISFLFAIPYIIIYGITTRRTPCPNIFGKECFADDKYFKTIWPLLNNLLFVLLYLFLSVSMVVLYILIGVTAWKHSKLPGASSPTAKIKNSDNSSNDDQPMTHRSVNSNLGKTELVDCGRIHCLLCCTGQHLKEKIDENTQSSVSMKTFTTTDTETGEEITETAKSDFNLVTDQSDNTFSSTMELQKPPESYAGLPDFKCFRVFEPSPKSMSNKACKISQKFESESSSDERSTQDSYINENISSNDHSENNPNQEIEMPVEVRLQQTTSSTNYTKIKSMGPGKTEIRRRRLGRMTAMLIIISAIFVLGFLPFLMLTVYKNRLPEKYASLDMVQLTFYNLFYRLYFLNSAVNPIIYSLCDLNFRRECIRLLTCKSRRHF